MKFFAKKKNEEQKEKLGKNETKIEHKTEKIEESAETKEKQHESKENKEKQQVVSTVEQTKEKAVVKDPGQENKILSDSKVQSIVNYLSEKEPIINPIIDFENNSYSYPFLKKVGLDEKDVSFLDKLTSEKIGILEKQTYERLVVCPEHPDSFLTTIRLHCPSCFSTDVTRLHLIEHKPCGFIAEKKAFGVKSVEDITSCPSCKRTINDYQKEIRLPGMWHVCNNCKTRFDDIVIKLYCRKYNHEFNIEKSETIQIPSYKLKSDIKKKAIDIYPLIKQIKELLDSSGFKTEELTTIKGKSGVDHSVSVYGIKNESNQSFAILIEFSDSVVADSTVDSAIVKLLDLDPTFSVLICIPSATENANAVAKINKVTLLSGQNTQEIILLLKQSFPQLRVD